MLFIRDSARTESSLECVGWRKSSIFRWARRPGQPQSTDTLGEHETISRIHPSPSDVTKPSPAASPGLDKRRSTRLVQAMPIKVHGVDALSESFTERTTTVMVSCHGCKYQSKHYVPKGSRVTLEIPRRDPNLPVRIVTGVVIWVQRPSQALDLLHIGLEFEVPGNVWDTPSAPEDWFPLPGERPYEEEIVETLPVPVAAPVAPVILTASWDASEILVMAGRAEGHEEEVASALHEAKSEAQEGKAAAAEAAIETLSLVRPKQEPGLHETIEQIVKASVERLSESLAEQARKAYQATADQLDAKIKQAVAEALVKVPVKRVRRKAKP
jgi:hypothetical protein